MKILVVGGGTAALVNAIILKKYLGYEIDIVKSDRIGIVGVGEGSTEHFKEFLKFSGIDQYSIIKECGATYKGGILFKNWNKKDYMHSVGLPFDSKIAQYSYVYARQIALNENYMQSSTVWENKISSWFINRPDDMPFNQFHFDTFKLNDFLIRFAKNLGINVYEDEIIDVKLNKNGEIDRISSKYKTYKYDFYIDATGFKRILISKLGGKWKSFSKFMKMNSAITFATEETKEYSMWTLAQAMNSGWLFRLPTQERYGNGYIFDKNHISVDEAKQEAENLFGQELTIGKQFNFDPGAIEKAWIKNCVAVGLSSLFVEPLEASSIGSSIQQAFLLMHRITNYDNKTIEEYNKSFIDLTENIRDFIVLHYICERKDTEFWKEVSQIELPDSLNEKMELWKNHLPIHEDFNNFSDYVMFTESNFILVLDGLDLFDRNSIANELFTKPNYFIENAEKIIEKEKIIDRELPTIGHKEFIKLVKKYF